MRGGAPLQCRKGARQRAFEQPARTCEANERRGRGTDPRYCQPHGGQDPAPHISVAYTVSGAVTAQDLRVLSLAHMIALAPRRRSNRHLCHGVC